MDEPPVNLESTWCKELKAMAVWIWFGLGIALCVAELIFPTAFVELMMGFSALIVALIALVVPSVLVQALLWLVISVGLVWLSRRFIPKPRSHRILQESVEAKTLTAILPGEKGRVIYDGNSWQARCEDAQLEIAADERVYVVRREGTTLVVLPERMVGS
jgi:membrane protein implicated in regulation of membrane protease activity